MDKSIWQEVKEIFIWLRDMTTFRTIIVNFVFLGVLALGVLAFVGVVVIIREGCIYVWSLYQQSDPSDKLAAITAILGTVFGSILSVLFAWAKKNINKDAE